MDIAAIVQYIVAHYGDISALTVAAVAFASVVVGITPTKTDDAFLEKAKLYVVKVLNFISVVNPKDPK